MDEETRQRRIKALNLPPLPPSKNSITVQGLKDDIHRQLTEPQPAKITQIYPRNPMLPPLPPGVEHTVPPKPPVLPPDWREKEARDTLPDLSLWTSWRPKPMDRQEEFLHVLDSSIDSLARLQVRPIP